MCHTQEQSSLPMLLLLLWSYIVIRLEGLREKGSGLEGVGFRKLRSLMCLVMSTHHSMLLLHLWL